MTLLNPLKTIATLWQKVLKGAPESKPSINEVAQCFDKFGHGAIVGMTGSGKTLFAEQLSQALSGCRVLIQLEGPAPLGWNEAPFRGALLRNTSPQSSSDSQCGEDWDFEDVLQARPEGLFVLRIPSFSTDKITREALSHIIERNYEKSESSVRLSLFIDESLRLVEENVLEQIAKTGRRSNTCINLVLQSLSSLPDSVSHELSHICITRHSSMDSKTVKLLQSCSSGDPASSLGIKTSGLGDVTYLNAREPENSFLTARFEGERLCAELTS